MRISLFLDLPGFPWTPYPQKHNNEKTQVPANVHDFNKLYQTNVHFKCSAGRFLEMLLQNCSHIFTSLNVFRVDFYTILQGRFGLSAFGFPGKILKDRLGKHLTRSTREPTQTSCNTPFLGQVSVRCCKNASAAHLASKVSWISKGGRRWHAAWRLR